MFLSKYTEMKHIIDYMIYFIHGVHTMPELLNQKLDTSLQTSLTASAEELEKSESLSFGYLPAEKMWEVIVRYTGNLGEVLSDFPGIAYYELMGGYGILYVPAGLVDAVAELDAIIYMEKPNALYFEDYDGKRASCITAVQTTSPSQFSGKGVLVGIIDSGIDYAHPDFRNADGSTRIAALWDQSLEDAAPAPGETAYRGLFTAEQINEALAAPTEAERYAICPSVDLSGHGTHVAGIAAGNGAASSGLFRGVAYESALLVVKLASPMQGGFPSTTQLMRAVDFCLSESLRRKMPLALNLSFGNTYGSHSGTSLLETYLNFAAAQGQCSIAVGSGNEGAEDGHINGRLTSLENQNVEFTVSDYTASLTIQIWKLYEDDMNLSIGSPVSGDSILLPGRAGIFRYTLGQTELLVNYGVPSPYSIYQEIRVDLIPKNSYLDSGIWSITLIPRRIRDGAWEMWMPSASVRNYGTRFLTPTASTTLTIPSTASQVITVGAYDSATDQPASFSGRGDTWGTNQSKPDLVAPGVDITSCAPGGGYTARTGTSMATPFVTGSCALFMQWGILNRNDSFLYGEKLKAYLRRGARKLPAFSDYPNPQVGWGALCLKDSLP
jgi:subtilisin family serine protease